MTKWVLYLDRAEKHFGKEEFLKMLKTLPNKEILQRLEEIEVFTHKTMLYRWKKHFGVVIARKPNRTNDRQAGEILREYKSGATYAILIKKYSISSKSLRKIIGENARLPQDRFSAVKNKYGKQMLADYLDGASTTELILKYHVTGATVAKIIGDKMRPVGRPKKEKKKPKER
jgi:Mor family transcriptional regulator